MFYIVKIEENEVLKNYQPFLSKDDADYKVDPASFLNRTVLNRRRPISSYSQFSFKKPTNLLTQGVLDKTYNPKKYDVIHQEESQGKLSKFLMKNN